MTLLRTCVLVLCSLAGEGLGLVRLGLPPGQLLQEGVHRHLQNWKFRKEIKKVNKKEITLSIKKATKKNDQEKNRKEMENAN